MANHIKKNREITVKQLKKILMDLEEEGYGDCVTCFGYDSDFAYTTINGKYEIEKDYKNDTAVWFFGFP